LKKKAKELLAGGAMAREINQAHRSAHSYANDAVKDAIRCGQLLIDAKRAMPHGDFRLWIEKHCEFEQSTATRYMKAAAQNATGVAFSSLRSLFQSGTYEKNREAQKPKSTPKPSKEESPKPAKAETAKPALEAPKSTPRDTKKTEPKDEPEYVGPDENEEAELELAQKEYETSIAKVMDADDKLAAAHKEIKRQSAEIAALKISRNGFQNGKAAVERLLGAEQRKVAKLEKRLSELEAA
jgi:Protein of unknown function (DUF3102)